MSLTEKENQQNGHLRLSCFNTIRNSGVFEGIQKPQIYLQERYLLRRTLLKGMKMALRSSIRKSWENLMIWGASLVLKLSLACYSPFLLLAIYQLAPSTVYNIEVQCYTSLQGRGVWYASPGFRM